MTKNTRKVLNVARKVLYDVVDEIEISNSIQIAQNNEKIEALAENIVATTKSASYAEFLSELYYKATLMFHTEDCLHLYQIIRPTKKRKANITTLQLNLFKE